VSTPIEFVSTGDLLRELKSRFDEMLFVGFQATTPNNDSYTVTAKGSMHGTMGLIVMAQRAAEGEHDE